MSQIDYDKMFRCPHCGTMGAIYFLKVAGNKIVIKQRCPKHGGRSLKVPLVQKHLFISSIRDAVFRCYKCGEKAIVESMKAKGPWTLIRCSCPTHGNNVPFQKIWNSIYAEISSARDLEPEPISIEPPKREVVESKQVEKSLIEPKTSESIQKENSISEEKTFCPNCGEPLKGFEKFCGACGSKLA